MNSRKLKGFSIVELGVVLAILGIVFVGVFSDTGEIRSVTKQLESEAIQKDIKKQLMKFAMVNKYLPCPDSDANPDGMENRTAVAVGTDVFNVCSADFGAVPYLDIGMKRADVQDAYGNFIRYAVNRNADDQATVVICDDTSSASFFCNATPGEAAFNLRNTPPIAGNNGLGNYSVCNENTAPGACGAGATFETATAAVVLVAYNEDGATTLSSCGTANGASQENCTVDEFYHQAQKTSVAANFFDDTIVTITGYEIKSEILSPVVVWNNTAANTPLTPTYNAYDLNDGDYVPLDDASNPDVITVNRNITTALDLGQGNDYVVIGNDLSSEVEYNNLTGEITSNGDQAELNTGAGDDTVYIVNAANSAVYLGEGDDRFILGKDLTSNLSAESGNDKVWIQGNIVDASTTTSETTETSSSNVYYTYSPPAESTVTTETQTVSGNVVTTVVTTVVTDVQYRWREEKVTETTTVATTTETTIPGPVLDLGADDDVLWLGDSSNADSGGLAVGVNGGDGYDILVLENMTKDEWDADSGFQNNVNGFELVIFKSEGGSRQYEIL